MQPLKDIRVVAVTGFLAGPYASMNFARLGADVIKVELPVKGDPVRGNGPFIGPEGKHAQQQTPDDISTRFLKLQPRCEERYAQPQAFAGPQDVPRPCEVVRCDAGEPRARPR